LSSSSRISVDTKADALVVVVDAPLIASRLAGGQGGPLLQVRGPVVGALEDLEGTLDLVRCGAWNEVLSCSKRSSTTHRMGESSRSRALLYNRGRERGLHSSKQDNCEGEEGEKASYGTKRLDVDKGRKRGYKRED